MCLAGESDRSARVRSTRGAHRRTDSDQARRRRHRAHERQTSRGSRTISQSLRSRRASTSTITDGSAKSQSRPRAAARRRHAGTVRRGARRHPSRTASMRFTSSTAAKPLRRDRHDRRLASSCSRLVVLIAAAFVVGQAVLRQLQVTGGPSTRRSRVWHDAQIARGPGRAARAAGGYPGGCMLGAVGAWLASRWFPTGVASRAEPDPGIDFDVRSCWEARSCSRQRWSL